jgi:hypothetical protein
MKSSLAGVPGTVVVCSVYVRVATNVIRTVLRTVEYWVSGTEIVFNSVLLKISSIEIHSDSFFLIVPVHAPVLSVHRPSC